MNQTPTLFELVSFLKVFSAYFDKKEVSISKEEGKAAYDLLKKVADNRKDFTQEQKEQFSDLVEYGKTLIEIE